MDPFTALRRLAFPPSAVMLLIAQGCVFDQQSPGREGMQATKRGYYSVDFPGSGAVLDLDSSYMIRWIVGDSMTINPGDKPYATILLYRGDTLVQELANYAGHGLQGQYAWDLKSRRVPSGSGYRLKIVNPRAYSVWDFGGAFRIRSRYAGSITVTDPAGGFPAHADSQLEIKWRVERGNIGPWVELRLLRNRQYVALIDDSVSSGAGSFTWNRLYTLRGSGDDYRVQITSLSDPALLAYSPEFRVATGLDGGITLTSPKAGDTLLAGTMGRIAWSYADSPAVTVRFGLLRDSVPVPVFSLVDFWGSGTPVGQGMREWTVPGGIATSNRYRIRIESVQDPSIYSVSPYFSILGVNPDQYEPDDDLPQAGLLPVNGPPQTRNFSEYDEDWVRCEAVSGETYGFSVQAQNRIWTTLVDETGDTIAEFLGFTGSWKAKYNGHYFLRLKTEFFNHLAYTVSLVRFDASTGPALFFAPGPGSTWEAREIQDIYWAVDAGRLVPVSPELFREGAKVQTITCIETAYPSTTISHGPGKCSWGIPEGIATSSRFQIRLGSGNISVFSPYFTIRGETQDAFEPDDSPAQSKSITAGGPPQSRSWTIFNPDWLRFNTRPGMHYVVGIRSEVYSYLQGFDGSATRQITLQAGYAFQSLIQPTETGLHFLRLEPAGGLYGPYSLSLTEFDSASGPPSRLTSPDSVNGCPAGSACRITWIPDSTIFGDQVCLSLYLDTSYAANVTPAGTPNNGVYDWPDFQTFPPSSRYRIKIKNCYAPEIISAFGPYFSIP